MLSCSLEKDSSNSSMLRGVLLLQLRAEIRRLQKLRAQLVPPGDITTAAGSDSVKGVTKEVLGGGFVVLRA